MVEHLAGHEYYFFLDGYYRYNQISMEFEDQGKTTFTCPFMMLSTISRLLGYAMHPPLFSGS
jgi:hypothetical protein